MTDEQYRTRADGHDDWFRTAYKVTNRSGLESAGQVSITYDPSFESVSISFIHLIRDGKVIDLTHDTQFRTVEHEGDLDDGIVSGTLKKMANPRDVRAGDVIDYATIVHAHTSLWPGNAFYHFSQRYSDPLALRTLRFVWPAGMDPQYKSINSDIAFSTRKTPEGTEWEWTAQDPPALQLEDDVPTTAFAWGQTDVSTMKDWAAVSCWATALYRGDDSLPDDFAAKLDAIAKASPVVADRLTAAARYVQDNIRYVGEELGEGSYVPRRPRTVLARGYGDCKDKALLLAVALRRLGIDAVPALVSTRVGARLPDRLPSPLEFDHVIVRAVVDRKVVWIDATGTHRGGRGLAIVPSDLGFALPIRDGQTALEPITGYADHAGRMTVLERFSVDEAASIKPEMDKVSALIQKNDQPSKLEALAALTAAAAKVAHPSPAAGLIDGMKGAILAELQRPQAALAAFQSATAQYDGNPEVFRLWIAYELDLGTAESVARALDRTRKVQPKIVAALDKRWVQAALQKTRRLAPNKREPIRQDMCITLADAGWQQDPRTVMGGGMLGCAIAAHSLRGETAEVRAGLAKDPPTDTLLTLAIDRRHQALWADLDRASADHFRRSLDREADRAGAGAAAAPRNYEAVMYRMQTLRALGRFQEAVASGKALATDKAQIEIVGADAFWLVNEYAANLRALGRTDDAISALDSVLALGLDRYPDLVSIAINRAEIVVAAGRYQAGLDSLNALESDHLDQLSPYGKMWVWANQVCALHALGRDEDAKTAIAKLSAKPDDNWSAATAAAACRDDTKTIADMLITRLRDSDARPAALGLFILFDTPEARTPLEQSMRQAVAKARALPEVKAEFAKVGRVIRYAGTTQGQNEF